MNTVGNTIVTVLAVCLLIGMGADRGLCQSDYPSSSVPPIEGGCSAPISVRSATFETYAVTGKDMDTYIRNPGATSVLVSDFTLWVEAEVTPSMPDGLVHITLRSRINDTVTWDVTGTAHSAPGTYYDTFYLYNAREYTDILCDADLGPLTQVVNVTAM